MGFRSTAYCTIWEVSPKSDTLTRARISISRKNKQTEQYEQDFSGFIDFVGTACAHKAKGLQPKDRIKLGDVDVTNRYDKEARKEYTNFKVFSFDLLDEQPREESGTEAQAEQAAEEAAGDDLPF